MLKQVIMSLCLVLSCCGTERIYGMDFLTAKNGHIYDESGNKITLRGMSSHGIAWYGHFYNEKTLRTIVDDWQVNVFRIAMYTEEWGGYISNNGIKNKVNELVQICIDLGIYVIIDWHILKDGSPMTHVVESEKFFDEMSKLWGSHPNVIYEICNEPNGWANWSNSIKQYAERVIPVIRKNAPRSMVIVGTGSWSQDILDAASNPLKFDNIALALHFYAGTHGDWLMQRIPVAMQKGSTVFVSEWGTSQSSGNGGVYINESRRWLDFLEKNQISWVNWSLAPKQESSAALRETASVNGHWSDSDLTDSGRFVKSYLLSKAGGSK